MPSASCARRRRRPPNSTLATETHRQEVPRRASSRRPDRRWSAGRTSCREADASSVATPTRDKSRASASVRSASERRDIQRGRPGDRRGDLARPNVAERWVARPGRRTTTFAPADRVRSAAAMPSVTEPRRQPSRDFVLSARPRFTASLGYAAGAGRTQSAALYGRHLSISHVFDLGAEDAGDMTSVPPSPGLPTLADVSKAIAALKQACASVLSRVSRCRRTACMSLSVTERDSEPDGRGDVIASPSAPRIGRECCSSTRSKEMRSALRSLAQLCC